MILHLLVVVLGGSSRGLNRTEAATLTSSLDDRASGARWYHAASIGIPGLTICLIWGDFNSLCLAREEAFLALLAVVSAIKCNIFILSGAHGASGDSCDPSSIRSI